MGGPPSLAKTNGGKDGACGRQPSLKEPAPPPPPASSLCAPPPLSERFWSKLGAEQPRGSPDGNFVRARSRPPDPGHRALRHAASPPQVSLSLA